jgi:hypothetical protein
MTDSTDLAVVAGSASTALFVLSTLPILAKARRTHDLGSYSLGNLLLANVGNLVHSIYVLSLPLGPIWALHGFYTATSLTMLAWFLRYGVRGNTHRAAPGMGIATEAPVRAAS